MTEAEIRKLMQFMDVRRRTPLQDRVGKAEKQHEHQLPEQEKGRDGVER